MMRTKMDQTFLPAHSEAKIKLLRMYLEAYLGIISRDRHTEHIHLTDVFCGPGEYAEKKEGSPIVIARMLAALHKKNPSAPKTTFLANDIISANTEKVEMLIRPLDNAYPKLTISTSNKDARDILNVLKSQIVHNHEKRFLFIDPFGYKDVLIDDILTLISGARTELLLFQPSSFMFRFSEKGTPCSLKGLLSSLSAGEAWPQGLDLREYIEHTKRLLQKRIGNNFFVDTFTIQKDPQTLFCLFFVTPHIKGFEKMLEAKWKLNKDSGAGWHYSETLANSLFTEPNPQVARLNVELDKMLSENDFLTNVEIYELTLRHCYLPKHSREVLSSWQKSGKIKVFPESTRKGAFFINYENFRDKTRKIRIHKVRQPHG